MTQKKDKKKLLFTLIKNTLHKRFAVKRFGEYWENMFTTEGFIYGFNDLIL